MKSEIIVKKFHREIVRLNKQLDSIDNEIENEKKNLLISAYLYVETARKILEELKKEE